MCISFAVSFFLLVILMHFFHPVVAFNNRCNKRTYTVEEKRIANNLLVSRHQQFLYHVLFIWYNTRLLAKCGSNSLSLWFYSCIYNCNCNFVLLHIYFFCCSKEECKRNSKSKLCTCMKHFQLVKVLLI